MLPVSSSVINKAGGGGTIAMSYLNQRPGDGHYLFVMTASVLTNNLLGVSKDTYTDFTPLASVALTEKVVLALVTVLASVGASIVTVGPVLSPPVGVLVVLVRRRSACSVVDTDDWELQSLVGFGSRSLAPLVGSADAAPPLGALPPVHKAVTNEPLLTAVLRKVSALVFAFTPRAPPVPV